MTSEKCLDRPVGSQPLCLGRTSCQSLDSIQGYLMIFTPEKANRPKLALCEIVDMSSDNHSEAEIDRLRRFQF
jgi:hypothetical protein